MNEVAFSRMSVEELKKTVATLSAAEQAELTAFLFHLRHRSDAGYRAALDRRANESEASRWLTPEQFEEGLDAQ